MVFAEPPGQIAILNGTPHSGKSSIAVVIQNTFEGIWFRFDDVHCRRAWISPSSPM
jgi:chloramphenicol 3-O-phosphotransferase